MLQWLKEHKPTEAVPSTAAADETAAAEAEPAAAPDNGYDPTFIAGW